MIVLASAAHSRHGRKSNNLYRTLDNISHPLLSLLAVWRASKAGARMAQVRCSPADGVAP